MITTPYQSPTTSTRGPIIAGLTTIAVFFGGFGTWAALAPLDGAVVAPAIIKVEDNRKAVQHRDGGIIRDLLVREGDSVGAGQVLLRLDDSDLRAEIAALSAQLVAAKAREARLVAELRGAERLPDGLALPADSLAGEQALLDSRRRALDNETGVLSGQMRELEEQIAGHRAQITALTRQIVLIEDELDGTRALEAKGWAPKTKVRALERTAAQLEGQRAERQADIAKATQAIAGSELRIAQLRRDRDAEASEQLREAQARATELEPKLSGLLAQLGRTELRAPQAGLVVGLTAFTEGGVIAAGKTVMEIVPTDRPLVATARLRPEDIDDVHAGLRAEVRLTGLNQRSTIPMPATVRRLSADRLIDGGENATPYYEMLVEIAADALPATPVLAGMPAEVTVPLKARTALDYLLEPLAQQLAHVGNEM